MKCSGSVLACISLATLTVCTSASLRVDNRVGPVQKVVQLLGELEQKIIKNGEAEDKAFVAYSDWCKTGAQEKGFEIKTATAEIEDLKATIDQAAANIETSTSKIEDTAASIATSTSDLTAATEIREKEHAEFTATEAELVDAVDTLERATNILQRKFRNSALVQAKVNSKDVQNLVHTLGAIVDAAGLSLHDRQTLTALAQRGDADDGSDDDADLGAPAPKAYESHSESIIDVLEDLKQKAETELTDVRRAEASARHNYEMLKQSLEDQMKVDNKEMVEAKTAKASATETKAVAEGDLAVEEKTLADAKEVLANMASDCAETARDHEASVASRAEELKALAAAKQALQDMTSGAVSVTYNSAFFLQVDGSRHALSGSNLRSRADLANFEVVNLIRKLAKAQHSAALTQLAGRISAAMKDGASSGDDPFAKVKALISEMIERLVKEAGEEAEHKAYCDKEMAETKQKMDELKYDLQKLNSKIDKASAESANLKAEVATLSKELAEMATQQAEADKIRQEEHKVYLQEKSDLEQGIEGVRLALKVLRDYYAAEPEASAAAAAMFQQPAKPETHTSASGAGTTIIGMLEVVESDFAKAAASNEVEEQSAATAYEKLSMENRVSKAMKEQDVKYKTKEAAALDKSITEFASDRDSAQSELDAVLEYSANIRGMCIAKPESYEERKGRREQEIAGLKEALSILEGEAGFLQRRVRN